LAEADFERNGIVTPEGETRLREFLSEVPADRLKSPIKAAEIPKLFTVETFTKMIIREQRAASGA
jgi:hypothetical protein